MLIYAYLNYGSGLAKTEGNKITSVITVHILQYQDGCSFHFIYYIYLGDFHLLRVENSGCNSQLVVNKNMDRFPFRFLSLTEMHYHADKHIIS